MWSCIFIRLRVRQRNCWLVRPNTSLLLNNWVEINIFQQSCWLQCSDSLNAAYCLNFWRQGDKLFQWNSSCGGDEITLKWSGINTISFHLSMLNYLSEQIVWNNGVLKILLLPSTYCFTIYPKTSCKREYLYWSSYSSVSAIKHLYLTKGPHN